MFVGPKMIVLFMSDVKIPMISSRSNQTLSVHGGTAVSRCICVLLAVNSLGVCQFVGKKHKNGWVLHYGSATLYSPNVGLRHQPLRNPIVVTLTLWGWGGYQL